MNSFHILTSSNDSCIQYGKKLLTDYLLKASLIPNEKEGHTFELLLAYETTKYLEFAKEIKREDGFAFLNEMGKSIFLAKTPRGLLYSIVTYLQDDLGVRFFHEDEEYIPLLSEVLPPKERVINPPFKMRNYLVGKCYNEKLDKKDNEAIYDEMVKNRVLDVFTPLDLKHGGKAKVYGRNVSHNFRLYCPFEKYEKTHPEFFQEIHSGNTLMKTIDITNGIRDEDGTLDESKDVSVVKVVIEEMKKDVLNHPDCSYFSITQEDGKEHFEDEHNQKLEKKYKRSGMLIRFCNVIARALSSWAKETLGRDIYIITFGYDYASEAPVKEENGKIVPIDSTVIADSHLIIQLALFSNAGLPYFSKKQDKSLVEKLKNWKIVAKTFWFWAYDIDFANYYAFIDSFYLIKQNVLDFYNYGIEYLLMQGTYDANRNWQCDARSYVYDRLMWDFSLDQDALLKEYLDAYYGPASKKVLSFIELYHSHYEKLRMEGVDVSFQTWGNECSPEILPLLVVQKGLSLLKEGEKEIEASSLSEERKKTLLRRLYGVMTTPLSALYLNFDAYFPNGSKEEKEEAKQEFIVKADLSGETKAREAFPLDKYLHWVESEDYLIRPIYKNGSTISGERSESEI